MRAFISIGFLLQALLVLGHAESPASLEGRDLTSPNSIHPRQLSKRETSPKNMVVCPARAGEDPATLYLNDYNKLLTALVSRRSPCCYFANMAMAVFDQNGQPAHFTVAEPSSVRNWYGHLLTEQCEAQKPVLLRKNGAPLTADDYLGVGTVFYHSNSLSKQVENCSEEQEANVRDFVLTHATSLG